MGPREFEEALNNTRQTLLGLRGPHGHWEGELSSSALSTAIAVIALDKYLQAAAGVEEPSRSELEKLCDHGRAWLARTQNSDGGWGDTPISLSNISTTALGWAAFAQREEQYPEVGRRCAEWLEKAAGRLDPKVLARAITERYGKDRTFSVPILTTLALTGRLGASPGVWQLVPQLPFELAACPPQWFAWLRLPVVSYALPALIALGLVRHCHRPTWNPLRRGLRNLLRARVMRVLHSIQPSGGGFLEATPLTSFVVLSLTGAGLVDRSVTRAGVGFLVRSARPDGSWPIDTNLATWVTTLSVNALAAGLVGACVPHAQLGGDFLPREERASILDWLLMQQYRVEHPYTHAAPGGWAWTDLSGGVPDADDTAGALLAQRSLNPRLAPEAAALAAVDWLLNLQNRDGGMPTFCRGWGTLPFDRSGADLTAHAIRAWLAWEEDLPGALKERVRLAVDRGLCYLRTVQHAEGSWSALWFGNQHAPTEENLTYGTSRVLLALADLKVPPASGGAAAISWLMRAQNPDGGWGGMPRTPSSVEETGLALESLAAAWKAGLEMEGENDLRNALHKGLDWLVHKTQGGTRFPPAPIGFYFARLWYHEKLYPVIFTLAALERSAQLARRLWNTTPEKVRTR